MTNADIKRHGRLDPPAKQLLNISARCLGISTRAYMRSVKVARTIVDLEASSPVTPAHISEALVYRSQTYKE
jgi:magnesium chelatase family protein